MQPAIRFSATVLRGLALGALLGFAVCGPLSVLVFLAGERGASGPLIPALALSPSPPKGYAPALQVAQTHWANRNSAALLVGSSEFWGNPGVPHLLGASFGHDSAPVVVGYDGSAIWRAGLLAESLARYGAAPRRMIIVVNPYYAQHFVASPPERLAVFFSDVPRAHLHACRTRPGPTTGDSDRAHLGRFFRPGEKKFRCADPLQLEWQALRAILQRSVGSRVARLTRTGKLFADQSRTAAVARARGSVVERRRQLRLHLEADSQFVRSLAFLRDRLDRLPETRAAFLLLPLNRNLYAQVGLDARAEEAHFVRVVRATLTGRDTHKQPQSGTSGPRRFRFRVAESLRSPDLFVDSVHYTEAGRRRLVAEIHASDAQQRGR